MKTSFQNVPFSGLVHVRCIHWSRSHLQLLCLHENVSDIKVGGGEGKFVM